MREFDPEAGEELGNGRDEAIDESFPASDPPGGGPRRRAAASRAPARTTATSPCERRDQRRGRGHSSRTATTVELDHGRVVIAAITSCTNTSNPSVMLGAGLLARKAVERGLRAQALGEDLARAGLDRGHRVPRAVRARRVPRRSSSSTWSATAAPPASATPARCRRRSRRRSSENDLVVCAVLSGNRNFEGRINPDVQGELPGLAAAGASPTRSPGGWTSTSTSEPLGEDSDGEPVYLRDIWPERRGDQARSVGDAVRAGHVHASSYADVFTGDERWQRDRGARGRPLHLARLDLRPQARASSRGWTAEPTPVEPIAGRPRARACSATRSPPTTSRRPARSRRTARPAGG